VFSHAFTLEISEINDSKEITSLSHVKLTSVLIVIKAELGYTGSAKVVGAYDLRKRSKG